MKDSIELMFLKHNDPMDEWDKFVENSPQGSLFCNSWWLKAVCPNQFEIILLKQGSEILAGMPLHKKRIWGLEVINMPPLTPFLGVLFPPNKTDKYEKNLSAEMSLLKLLVNSIPNFKIFNVSFHYNFSNWLPFYWAGYNQTTLYSYIIEDLTNLNKVFSEFAYSKRKNIKKAITQVEILEDLSPDKFYSNHKYTLAKYGKSIIYKQDLFTRIYNSSIERNSGKTWYAIDENKNIHAAIFIIFDAKSAFFLISSIDPDYKESGSVTLLIKHAIEYLAPLTKKFDFEGSMNEGIESSFRRFGAKQTTYFNISRNNFVLEILQRLVISVKKLKYH